MSTLVIVEDLNEGSDQGQAEQAVREAVRAVTVRLCLFDICTAVPAEDARKGITMLFP